MLRDQRVGHLEERYRSVIFFVDADQRRIAQAYIAQLENAGVFSQAITTQIEAFKGFSRPSSIIRTIWSITRPSLTS